MLPKRILIVDDIPQVRNELHALLSLVGDIEIVGEAANGLEAIRLATTLRPDVVLMDLEMPLMNGYEATRWIKLKSPTCRVIVLTLHENAAAEEGAHQAGADAFIVKGAPLECLLSEITRKE